MATMSLQEIEHFDAGADKWGVSCTGLWLHPEFIRAQKCPVVLLDRNVEDIRSSMLSIGFAPIEAQLVERFDLLDFPRFDMEDMLNDEDVARDMWEILRPDAPFNAPRWRLLREIKMEPDLDLLKKDPRVVRRLLQAAAGRM